MSDPPRLGAQGARFTLDGQPAFLLGASYYAGQGAPDAILRRDLDLLQEHGFNWIRAWTTWAAFGHDVSSVDTDGYPRAVYLERSGSAWSAQCGQRRMVVDVTFSRGNGATGPPRLQGLEPHRRAVRVVVERLRDQPNWYLDLANERNVMGTRYVGADAARPVPAGTRAGPPPAGDGSCAGGDLTADEVRRSVQDVGLDFLALHRPAGRGVAGTDRAAHPRGAGLAARARPGGAGALPGAVPPRLRHVAPTGGGVPRRSARRARRRRRRVVLPHRTPGRRPRGPACRSFDLREQGLFDQRDEVEREVVQEIRRLAPG